MSGEHVLVTHWASVPVNVEFIKARSNEVRRHYKLNKAPIYTRNLYMSYMTEVIPFQTQNFKRQHQAQEIVEYNVSTEEMFVGDYSVLIEFKFRELSENKDIDEIIKVLAKMYSNVEAKEKQVLDTDHGVNTDSAIHLERLWFFTLKQFIKYKYALYATFSSHDYPRDIKNVN
jgi:hypothetical protein